MALGDSLNQPEPRRLRVRERAAFVSGEEIPDALLNRHQAALSKVFGQTAKQRQPPP